MLVVTLVILVTIIAGGWFLWTHFIDGKGGDGNGGCQYNPLHDATNITTILQGVENADSRHMVGGWINMSPTHQQVAWQCEGVNCISAGHMTPTWEPTTAEEMNLGTRTGIRYFFYTLGGQGVGGQRWDNAFATKNLTADNIHTMAQKVHYTDSTGAKHYPNGVVFDMEGMLGKDQYGSYSSAIDHLRRNVIVQLQDKGYNYFVWCPIAGSLATSYIPQATVPNSPWDNFTHVAPMFYEGNRSYEHGLPEFEHTIGILTEKGYRRDQIILTFQSFSAFRHPEVLQKIINVHNAHPCAGVMGWPSLDDPAVDDCVGA